MYKLALTAENVVFGCCGDSVVVVVLLHCCSSSKSLGAWCLCCLLTARPPSDNISHQVLWVSHLELKHQSLQSLDSGSERRLEEVKCSSCLDQHSMENNHLCTASSFCTGGPTEWLPDQPQTWEVD